MTRHRSELATFVVAVAIMGVVGASHASAQKEVTVIVKPESAAIFSTPSATGQVLMQVVKGRTFTKATVEGEWVRVDADGRIGYIALKDVNVGATTTRGPDCVDNPPWVTYVFSKPTVIRETPEPNSRVLATAPVNGFGIVMCTKPGALRIALVKDTSLSKDDGAIRGWFSPTPADLTANLVPEPIERPALRDIAMKDKPWPPAVKSSILRRRVGVGFTKDQVSVALGKPARVTSEESAAGVTEVWLYVDQSITFRSEKVSLIRRSK